MLYLMVVFSPWAFGTTQAWSIWCMNGAGYLLGGMLFFKRLLQRRYSANADVGVTTSRVTALLASLTFAILAYILIAAINAEFIYVPFEWRLDPRPHVKWLPHSLDRDATWNVFWNWVGLACAFWAAHDWLANDIVANGRRSARRLRRLVFVLAVNGALLALEGIIQRQSGTARLLWILPTRDNPTASAQFGPYAYRSNAAQLMNLLWPMALAVWWQRQFQGERRSSGHHWLLPCGMLLMAGSLVSLSRGGVGVALAQLAGCAVVFVTGTRMSGSSRTAMALVFAATVAAAFYIGWEPLAERLRGMADDPLSGRRETYELAERMVDDYPLFGVGPGAFGSTFQFYRNSPADYWPGQLHNDWLEFLITFGWAGCSLILAAGAVILLRWFGSGGVRASWPFVAFFWIALAGCGLHARFDFPLQIYSIQFVFVLLCAMLFSLSKRSS